MMIYQPKKSAEQALEEKVLNNVILKFGKMRNSFMTFPVNPAVWSIFMNHCMWAVLHLSKDDEELRKIQTIIETVRAQFYN